MEALFEYSTAAGHRFRAEDRYYDGNERLWRCAHCGLHGFLSVGEGRPSVRVFSGDQVEPRSWYVVTADIVCRAGRFGMPVDAP